MARQSFGTQHRRTKRTMGLLYIILSLLLNDEVHSVFEVMKYPDLFSWQRALHRCDDIRRNLTFAVPVVNLSSMTVLDKIDLQGEAWVGYFQTYEYFLFIVCVPLSEIESSVSARFNIGRHYNRPGMCYSLCGLQGYIGLQDDLCYCIETRTFSSPDIHSVNSSCENPLHCANGMLCGNLGYIKISVYKKVFISSNYMGGHDSGCLIVAKGREYTMSIASCTGRFQHLCESYTGQTIHLEESPTNDQWVFSVLNCAKPGKKPTTFIGNGTNFVFPIISGSWWTSVVRDLVIRNCSESMTIKGTTVYEGFLTNSNEGIKLEFVHARKYSRKQFVACMSEQPRNEQENSTNKPAETTITSAPSEAPTTPLIPEASTHESLAIPVPGIAGGTVAGFVAILCLVIGIFLWRRHKHAKQNEHDNDIKREREERSQIEASSVKQDASSGKVYEGLHCTDVDLNQYQELNDIALEENRNANIRPPENDSYEKLHPYTNSDIEMYSSLTNPEISKDSDEKYENTCLG